MLSKSTSRLSSISLLCGASIVSLCALSATVANAQTPAPAPAAAPAAPAAPAVQKLVVSGLIDGYYQYTTPAKDQTNIVPSGLAGGAYNVRSSTPTLNLAELNLTYAPLATGGVGYKATLIAGDTADINHFSFGSAGGNRESRFKNVQQLYVTWLAPQGYGIDLGKFYTPFGYEVTESNANWNYSRSTLYNLLPIYHAGARIYTPSMKGFVLTGYIVDALYNSATEGVNANNKSPKFIGQINFTDPNNKYTFIENVGGGTDKPAGVSIKEFISDTDFTYTINPNDGVGLNYDYVTSQPSGTAKTTTNGWAVYYRHQLNPKDAVALRYSGYQAKTSGVSPDFKPFDITATYEIKSSSQWLSRFEYRYDNANTPVFVDENGVADKKRQSSFIASEVFTF